MVRDNTPDALATMGQVLPLGARGRDAVHVAVVAAEAGEILRPGQHVALVDRFAYSEAEDRTVGIVDPFLAAPVRSGESFWVFVYPRTTTSLRHVWTHSSIPDEVAPDDSDKESRYVTDDDERDERCGC